MSDQPGPSLGTTAGARRLVPASIAIFQYDHEAFKLKDPKIIPLPLAFSMQSTSELWKTSMVKKNDQDAQALPLTSFCLVRSSNGGYTLMLPHGLRDLEVTIDKVLLTQQLLASGYRLSGGELVKLFCIKTKTFIEEGVTIQKRTRVGPVVFQYRKQTPFDPLAGRGQVFPGQRSLDNLPLEILRMIFANLPVNEAVYNVPATCKKFFEALREGVAFNQWEISKGCLTTQEAAFCQGWTANPVSHLVLRKVQMVDSKDSRRFYQFMAKGMEPSRRAISSFETDLEFQTYDCAQGPQRCDQLIFCSNVGDALVDFTSLKKVKLQGFPTQMIGLIGKGEPLVNVEHLWIGCKGKAIGPVVFPADRPPQLPKLKKITLKFSLEGNPPAKPEKKQPPLASQKPTSSVPMDTGSLPTTSSLPSMAASSYAAASSLCAELESHIDLIDAFLMEGLQESATERAAPRRNPPPTAPSREPARPPAAAEPPIQPPWDLEKLFSCFAPPMICNIQRFLILESTGDSWKACKIMLEQLVRLEGLSITIDAHLTGDELWDLIKSIPESVKFFKMMTPMSLTDDWCLSVVTACPNLEMFCCYGPEVTMGGVRPFAIGCERLAKLFVLHDENGTRVAREDVLPDHLKRGIRVYARELSRIFD